MSNQYRKLIRFGGLSVVISRVEYKSLEDFYNRPATHPDDFLQGEIQHPQKSAKEMVRRKAILPREGLTFDPILKLFQITLLNPVIIVPLFLFLQRSTQGKILLTGRGQWLGRLKFFLIWSILYRVNNFLNWGATNNWKRDRFNPNTEIVVVTGGASGIGAAIVKDFADKGVKIVVLDVQPMTYSAPSNVHYYQVDLRSPTAISVAASKIRADLGHPTVLINNAGICRGRTLLDATEADIRLTFDVNVLSHFWLLKEFLPSMVAADHGHVVTVASVAGYLEAPQMIDYCASKAAAVSLHEGIRMELKYKYNAPKVRTTLVTQSFVNTPLFAGFGGSKKFFFFPLEPETLAESIVDGVLSGDGGHIIMPKAAGALPGVKGWSRWLQSVLRASTVNLMANWHGKQVINPDIGEEGESGLESTAK